MTLLAIFLALLFAYSLLSRRIERTPLTAAIVFTAAGALVAVAMPDALGAAGEGRSALLALAEIGLVLLLFTDASRTDLGVLRRIRALPVRLLGPGLLLTIALGAIAALGVFGELSLWEAGILAAILAPTDAGLGQVIVTSPRVPERIRQALNVEAGLNDGLAVPFLLFFVALAGGAGGEEARLSQFVVEQLGYGVAIGVAVGLGGGWLLHAAIRGGWMAEAFQQIGVVVLPLACALASEHFHASMFIAAFTAGLAVQLRFPEAGRHALEFTEEWGQVINLSVFFLFGLIAAGSLPQLGARVWLYALLSLTIVRMLPVAIALIGTRMSAASVAFMGWFGPRGLASIVLGLVYLEQDIGLPGEETIRLAVIATVLASVFAHGASASPGIRAYERRVASLGPESPEREAA